MVSFVLLNNSRRMAMNFHLRKFDITMLKDRCEMDSRKSPMMVVIGKKDTGKSFLVRDILYNVQREFPVGTVISATEAANEFFQHMVPSKLIHDKYKPEIVANVIRRQMGMKQKRNQDKASRGGSSSIDTRAFLILDDCLYDAKSWINEESTRYVFMNGRHIDLMTIITMQYPLGITPNLRTNVDFVFILRENILGNRRRIYENYAGMFPTFEMFCSFMDQCTENYECMVICNNVSSNKLEDQVFWYKASDHPPFKLCDQSLWSNNQPFTSAMMATEEYDPTKLGQKKGPSVWVKKEGKN
jgi:KaiC/GvpD/RAD55 family RecA-like ATPase